MKFYHNFKEKTLNSLFVKNRWSKTCGMIGNNSIAKWFLTLRIPLPAVLEHTDSTVLHSSQMSGILLFQY